ncbi:MAG TPA: alcohol dehydrogenase [Candidatus Binatia bacterium]|jgi:D-arabinose 1-dehydrogenase-like Zn-dependent alcohol dehydrogenase|nr:alcohol dehydrogenase [Candidatus Binatia bacterium]
MKAVQISKPGGDLEIVERPIPEPGRGQVRIKVEACGICHSDALVKEGHGPGIEYPRVPGHEIAGRVDKVGADVTKWKAGERVGVGWHGGHCFQCEPCRRGDFVNCKFEKITAIHFDGGYQEYMVVPSEAVALIPDELPAAEAAPLLCAGITVFNALRNSGARAGDLVAVQGIGGLGHLGIQYARQMGFHTIAIGRGGDKQALAKKLGAHDYIDTSTAAPAEALQKFGGANVVLATAPDSKSISALIDGLGPRGTLMVIGAGMESLTVTPLQLIPGSKTIRGWASGHARDSQDTLEFSALSGVRPMIERYPLEKAAAAYNQMISGKARFRVVITMT